RFEPGARVHIRFPVRGPYQGLLVPDTAILTDLDRKYLLVVDDKNVVHRRNVALGRLLEDGMRVILPSTRPGEGLRKTDWVVVNGMQRARINYPVEPLDSQGKAVAISGK